MPPDPRTVLAPDGTPIAVFELAPAAAESPARVSRPPGARTNRPPLLLVHGTTADHTTFRAAGPVLAATRRVFAMDRRGRGASGDGEGYSIEREYEDVAAVAEALTAEGEAEAGAEARAGGADVLGHSYGGRCALGASLRTPAIRRVVCYEGAPAAPGLPYRTPGIEDRLRAALDRGEPAEALAIFFREVVGMPEEDLARYRADPVWPLRVGAAHTILRELDAEASPAAGMDVLARVTAPVLLVVGSASRAPFGAATRAFAQRLPAADVVTIEGAAHAAHHTHVDAFVEAVTRFVDAGLPSRR